MTRSLRTLIGLAALIVFSAEASAQTGPAGAPATDIDAGRLPAAWAIAVGPVPSTDMALASDVFSQPRPGRRGSGPSAAAAGALIGAAAAVGVTYAAASRYGKNEGGSFCTRCFVQWSAFSAPVGAAAGAVIGWGVGRARRSVTATPVFSRRGKGVVISASF